MVLTVKYIFRHKPSDIRLRVGVIGPEARLTGVQLKGKAQFSSATGSKKKHAAWRIAYMLYSILQKPFMIFFLVKLSPLVSRIYQFSHHKIPTAFSWPQKWFQAYIVHNSQIRAWAIKLRNDLRGLWYRQSCLRGLAVMSLFLLSLLKSHHCEEMNSIVYLCVCLTSIKTEIDRSYGDGGLV